MAHRVFRAIPVHKGHKAFREYRAYRAIQALKGHKAYKAYRVRKAIPEHRVSVLPW